MINKLRLDQTKEYELKIATKKAAKMLVDFIQGREHILSLSRETGGIAKWDDLVIQIDLDKVEHIQIKRQHSDFSDAPCVRDTVVTRKSKNRAASGTKLRPLSKLDETLKELANWTNNNDPSTCTPKRVFVIKVPDNSIKIKDEITIGKLYDFCEIELQSSTTAQGLEELAQSSTSVKNIYNWLTTWCDFNDWNHIIKSLAVLKIRLCGNEGDIEDDTNYILSQCFTDCIAVRDEIEKYINANSSFTGAITPRPLLALLHNYLLPDISNWTQYQRISSNIWEISGTHDLSNSIEKAENIVPALWQKSQKSGILKFDSPILANDILPKSIIRLVIHFGHDSQAQIKDGERWVDIARNYVGNTLGAEKDDFKDLNVRSITSSYTTSSSRKLTILKEHSSEASELSLAMYEITWGKACSELELMIINMTNIELRDAIDVRWQSWKETFNSDKAKRNTLMRSMLHPSAEDRSIEADLRVGPKTVLLISQALYILLIVSVALNDNDLGCEKVGDDMTVHAIALNYWSGPTNQPRYPREISEDGVESLIGKESAKVLILSAARDSAEELLGHTLAYDAEQQDSMASPHRPKILVTHSRKLKALIAKGSLAELQDYFQQQIRRETDARAVNLNKISING